MDPKDYLSEKNKHSTQRQIEAMIRKSGLDPAVFVRMGELAQAAISDASQYPAFVQYLLEQGLEKDTSNLQQPDYQVLASLVVMGQVAAQMSQGA